MTSRNRSVNRSAEFSFPAASGGPLAARFLWRNRLAKARRFGPLGPISREPRGRFGRFNRHETARQDGAPRRPMRTRRPIRRKGGRHDPLHSSSFGHRARRGRPCFVVVALRARGLVQRADARSESCPRIERGPLARRAGADAKLGGIRTWRADRRHATRHAPRSAPLRPPLRAPILQRQPRSDRRDRSGRRRRRFGLDRRLSVLLLPGLRILLGPRTVPVLRRAPCSRCRDPRERKGLRAVRVCCDSIRIATGFTKLIDPDTVVTNWRTTTVPLSFRR